MESSMNYLDGWLLIVFYEGEDPMELVPDGWEIIDREEPSYYKGLLNPGTLTCRPPKLDK